MRSRDVSGPGILAFFVLSSHCVDECRVVDHCVLCRTVVFCQFPPFAGCAREISICLFCRCRHPGVNPNDLDRKPTPQPEKPAPPAGPNLVALLAVLKFKQVLERLICSFVNPCLSKQWVQCAYLFFLSCQLVACLKHCSLRTKSSSCTLS